MKWLKRLAALPLLAIALVLRLVVAFGGRALDWAIAQWELR